MIYLDNHATTRTDPRVAAAMLPFLVEHYGNPSSTTHRFGLRAAEAVEEARQRLADFIGADRTSEVIFTSGATESNNLALKGIAQAHAGQPFHLVTTAIEHPSVLETCRVLGATGARITMIQPDAAGVVDPARVAGAISADTKLVSVMLANNEVGSIQPIKEIAEIAHERGVLLHVDAAQALGKVDLNVAELGADVASFTAHKVYGPKGVGALYVRGDAGRGFLQPQMHGGSQENELRAGTLAVFAIVAFGVAVQLLEAEWRDEAVRVAALRDALWERLQRGLSGIHLNGPSEERLPGNLNVSFDGVLADGLIATVPEIAISSTSACRSAHGAESYVLKAMGLDRDRQRGAVRIGIGRFNTAEDIDVAAAAIIRAVGQLRSRAQRAHVHDRALESGHL